METLDLFNTGRQQTLMKSEIEWADSGLESAASNADSNADPANVPKQHSIWASVAQLWNAAWVCMWVRDISFFTFCLCYISADNHPEHRIIIGLSAFSVSCGILFIVFMLLLIVFLMRRSMQSYTVNGKYQFNLQHKVQYITNLLKGTLNKSHLLHPSLSAAHYSKITCMENTMFSV